MPNIQCLCMCVCVCVFCVRVCMFNARIPDVDIPQPMHVNVLLAWVLGIGGFCPRAESKRTGPPICFNF